MHECVGCGEDITQEIDKIEAAVKASVWFNITLLAVFVICAGGAVAGALMTLGKVLGLW